MATLTRGATTITPDLVLGWSMTSALGTVVHDILGATFPDFTLRPTGSRSGYLSLWFDDHASAQAAASALAVPGVPWLISVPEVPGLTMKAQPVGDLTVEAADAQGRRWVVRLGVREASL